MNKHTRNTKDNKNLVEQIQRDIAISNAKIINNDDDISIIKKRFGSKYTEDISDSDDDLSSYKNRNLKLIDELPDKNQKKIIKNKKDYNKKNDNESNESNKLNKIDNQELDIESEIESETESEIEPEYEYSTEFKNKVKDYVKNDDRIRELQTELKTLTSAKRVAEGEILKHLERMGESNINITGGKLRVNQYESKEGLKEDLIKKAMEEKIKDPKVIEFIFEKIMEERIANKKIQKSLKRTFERGDKAK